jgi:DNA-binding XRE family transcriptional regulator
MSIGYSANTIQLNKQADGKRLGVALGRAAIKHGTPVAEIAMVLQVSRQTVYNWFVGAYDPKSTQTKDIEKLIAKKFK